MQFRQNRISTARHMHDFSDLLQVPPLMMMMMMILVATKTRMMRRR